MTLFHRIYLIKNKQNFLNLNLHSYIEKGEEREREVVKKFKDTNSLLKLRLNNQK